MILLSNLATRGLYQDFNLDESEGSLLSRSQYSRIHFVVIIGEGLIGGSLRDYLVSICHYNPFFKLKLHWGHSSFLHDLSELKTTIFEKIFKENFSKSASQFSAQLSIVWSAGRGGFNATKEELEVEEFDFNSFLEALQNLSFKKPPHFHIDFHFTSSAGGLYEGQFAAIDEKTTPAPIRPYGFFKLKQEQKIIEMNKNYVPLDCYLYRLSTVYGRIRKGERVGLISKMLQNGVRKAITPITGDLFTLRDYIHSIDVAKILVTSMLESFLQINSASSSLITRSCDPQLIFVLSNKPTSIFEIKNIIEYFLKHKIYIQLSFNPGNSRDIIFRKLDPPLGVQTLDIRTGIKDILVHWYGAHP